MVAFPSENQAKKEEEKLMEESMGAPYGGEALGNENDDVKKLKKTGKIMPINADVAEAFARLERGEELKKSDVLKTEMMEEIAEDKQVSEVAKLNISPSPEKKELTSKEDEELKKIADLAVLEIEEMARTLINNGNSREDLMIKKLKEKIYNLEKSYNIIITNETFNRIGKNIYNILEAKGGDTKMKAKMLNIFNKLTKREVSDIAGIVGKEPMPSEIESELRRIKIIIERYRGYYKTLQSLSENRSMGKKEDVKSNLIGEIDAHIKMVGNIKNEDIKKEVGRLKAVRDYISAF